MSLPLKACPKEECSHSVGSHGGRESIADEQLIAGTAEGDREAISLLFRRFARPVRDVGRRILKDEGEADDLVQEVFLYIYRKSSLFDRT